MLSYVLRDCLEDLHYGAEPNTRQGIMAKKQRFTETAHSLHMNTLVIMIAIIFARQEHSTGDNIRPKSHRLFHNALPVLSFRPAECSLINALPLGIPSNCMTSTASFFGIWHRGSRGNDSYLIEKITANASYYRSTALAKP